mmetsp:Transcript_24354/g.52799  ORF Transcript_24354/g.52799 Transcript_24354/m.52799 type:complete len:100 (-) Transcript_24354:2-301(-)
MRKKVMWWTVNLCEAIVPVAEAIVALGVDSVAGCVAAAVAGAGACELIPGSIFNPAADMCAVGMGSLGAYCTTLIVAMGAMSLENILMMFACSQECGDY